MLDPLEPIISQWQEKVRHLEKEVAQASELLTQAQQELRVLLGARQIMLRRQFMSDVFGEPEIQLPLKDISDPTPVRIKAFDHLNVKDDISVNLAEDGTLNRDPPRDMTLVQEVLAIIAGTPDSIGPSEIRLELEKTNRIVPQNVMTGLLSRLTKEKRIVRLERGKYVALKGEDHILQKQTA